MAQIVGQTVGNVVGIEAAFLAISQDGLGHIVGSHNHIAAFKVEDIEGVGATLSGLGIDQIEVSHLLGPADGLC